MKFLILLLLVTACGKEAKEFSPRTLLSSAEGLTTYVVPECKKDRACINECEVEQSTCVEKCFVGGQASSTCTEPCRISYNKCLINSCDYQCSENPTPESVAECRRICIGPQ